MEVYPAFPSHLGGLARPKGSAVKWSTGPNLNLRLIGTFMMGSNKLHDGATGSNLKLEVEETEAVEEPRPLEAAGEPVRSPEAHKDETRTSGGAGSSKDTRLAALRQQAVDDMELEMERVTEQLAEQTKELEMEVLEEDTADPGSEADGKRKTDEPAAKRHREAEVAGLEQEEEPSLEKMDAMLKTVTKSHGQNRVKNPASLCGTRSCSEANRGMLTDIERKVEYEQIARKGMEDAWVKFEDKMEKKEESQERRIQGLTREVAELRQEIAVLREHKAGPPPSQEQGRTGMSRAEKLVENLELVMRACSPQSADRWMKAALDEEREAAAKEGRDQTVATVEILKKQLVLERQRRDAEIVNKRYEKD